METKKLDPHDLNELYVHYGTSIPRRVDVAHTPATFFNIVKAFVHGVNEIDGDRWEESLMTLETPEWEKLSIGEDVVLAKTPFLSMSSFAETIVDASENQLQLRARPAGNRFLLVFVNASYGWRGRHETQASTVLHRMLFDAGLPVSVGSLRRGPKDRNYKDIEGGDLPVTLLEGVEKGILPTITNVLISELNNGAVVVLNSQGNTARAFLPQV